MIQILVWWLIMQVLGWLALPTAMRIFRWLPDRGYAFSKALGLLLVSYFLWVGASTGLLNNDLAGILLSVILLAVLSSLVLPARQVRRYCRISARSCATNGRWWSPWKCCSL